MKRVYCFVVLSFMFIVNAFTITSINATNSQTGFKKDFLKLAVQIDNQSVVGEINSVIVPTRNWIIFFGEDGNTSKKVEIKKDIGPDYYCISGNHKYMAIVEDLGTDSYEVNLYNCNGRKLWSKQTRNSVRILGVADDGKRVLIRQAKDEETDYPIVKYLDENGNELVSIEGVEIEEIGNGYAVSNNGKYWISRNVIFGRKPTKWYFFNEQGKKIREQNISKETLLGIGNNGNYIYRVGKRSFLYNKFGMVINKYQVDDVILSKNGLTIFYTDHDLFFNEGKILYKVNKADVKKSAGNYTFIYDSMINNFSVDGRYIVIKLEQKSEKVSL